MDCAVTLGSPARSIAVASSLLIGALGGCQQTQPSAPAPSPAAARAPAPAPAPAPPPASPERSGAYGRHSFVAKRNGDTAIAVFTPFLPRNDAAFLGGASSVVETLFSTPLVASTARMTAEREVAVKAQDGREFFLFPVKEDTGEVHSIRVRQGHK